MPVFISHNTVCSVLSCAVCTLHIHNVLGRGRIIVKQYKCYIVCQISQFIEIFWQERNRNGFKNTYCIHCCSYYHCQSDWKKQRHEYLLDIENLFEFGLGSSNVTVNFEFEGEDRDINRDIRDFIIFKNIQLYKDHFLKYHKCLNSSADEEFLIKCRWNGLSHIDILLLEH